MLVRMRRRTKVQWVARTPFTIIEHREVMENESDAFRGCDYKTVGVSITDALTGGDVTEQKPHCDWEGFDDGKYKNAWNGCDWGSCDEWE